MTPSDSRPPDGGVRRKSVLYCPDCGHESTVDGDWRVEHTRTTGRERVAYACPDCGYVVTTRPTRGLAIA